MCSLMLSAQAAPTSASPVQGAHCDIRPSVHEGYETEFIPLHMNWVLVNDTKENPRTQMRWAVDR